MQSIILDYQDPLEVASGINESCWALLYSGMESSGSGKKSIIGMFPEEVISSADFDELANRFSSNQSKYENFWIGYLSYGLKNCLERLPVDEPSYINLPLLRFVRFGLIAVFDKKGGRLELHARMAEYFDRFKSVVESKSYANKGRVEVLSLNSNMQDSEYLWNVEKFRQHILDGDIFQANLTRKFYGQIKCDDGFGLFQKLCNVSPAPYSAYMRFEGDHIISSSPEKFLTITEDGSAESLPIKGTAPRGKNLDEDAKIKLALIDSQKNKSENLMIVDLMRSDFAKGSESGTVEVSELFKVDTYETLHHMSSRISGKKREGVSTLQFVMNCFPPGSMTGAPKIRAMEICSETEKMARGVYSGVLGWFGGDGSADLSVVIRTLIISGDRYEFQVGGAITSDSTPEDELNETLIKASGIASVLGIKERLRGGVVS